MDIEFHPYTKETQLKHNRRVKQRGDRSKFSKFVRDQVKEHFNHTCQMCGAHGIHVHHVEPRGSGKGRGVFTNALLLCNKCHKEVHDDDSLLRYWKKQFKKLYGPLYFMDADDLKMKYINKELRQEDKAVKEWKKHNEELDISSMVRMATESDQRRDESR
jgi:hypothetical protein